MFEKLKTKRLLSKLGEEALYEAVLSEIEAGEMRRGLWAKALANSDGSEARAKSLYITYRVESVKDEAELESLLAEQLRRNAPISQETEPYAQPSSNEHDQYPYSFLYHDVSIRHNNESYLVWGRKFDSANEARAFIDTERFRR